MMHLLLEGNCSNPPVGCAIERALETNIYTTLSPELRTSEEILHSRGNAESIVKCIVKRKLASRSERPTSDGWRLNDTEFDQIHNLYKFTVEGCCDVFCLNSNNNLPFNSEQNSLLDHDVSR